MTDHLIGKTNHVTTWRVVLHFAILISMIFADIDLTWHRKVFVEDIDGDLGSFLILVDTLFLKGNLRSQHFYQCFLEGESGICIFRLIVTSAVLMLGAIDTVDDEKVGSQDRGPSCFRHLVSYSCKLK